MYTNKIKMLVISSMALCTALSGCASLLGPVATPQECSVMNDSILYQKGYDAGKRGHAGAASSLFKACSHVGVSLDLKPFQKGYTEAVENQYCTAANFYDLATRGYQFNATECSAIKKDRLYSAWGAGKRVYDVKLQYERDERDLRKYEYRLTDLKQGKENWRGASEVNALIRQFEYQIRDIKSRINYNKTLHSRLISAGY